MARLEPFRTARLRASRLGEEIRWLLDHDVSLSTLAQSLGTTKGNISVIGSRQQAAVGGWRVRPITNLDGEALIEAGKGRPPRRRKQPRIRNPLDLGELQAQVTSIREFATRTGDFATGVNRLREMRPLFGDPRTLEGIEAVAGSFFLEAWLLTHLGYSLSSIEAAVRGYDIAVHAYSRSHEQRFLRLIEDIALVASNSHLIRRDTHAARKSLRIAKEARQMLNLRPTSEYYRLYATLNLQESKDSEALRFLKEAERLLRGETPTDQPSILLWKRQTNILDKPNWDGTEGSEEVLSTVAMRFQPGTIEYSNALNWDVATALSTDSPNALQRAEQLLHEDFQYVIGYGHQITIASLLRTTLVLPRRIRPEFARIALYANAFRDS